MAVAGSVSRIPRAPGRPVDLDHHALRVDSRLDQVERKIRTGLREQPRALAEDHGNDNQSHLVDQIVLQQPPGQGAAAVDLQLTPGLGLQLTDGRREVTAENGRVVPARRGERGRGNVLGASFKATPMGCARIWPVDPQEPENNS
jgi:hypothetical protein